MKLKEGQIKVLLDNLVVIVDTREKSNKHIIKYLEVKGIDYIERKLDSGDYSVIVKANENIGNEEIDLSEYVAVERKKDLDELAQNLTKHRDRFFREFERFNGNMTIVVEESSYMDLLTHNYRSQYNEQGFNASLMSIKAKYNIDTFFLHKKQASPIYILTFLKSFAKKYLREVYELEEIKEVS